MKIKDLINNHEFVFNCDFRILEYLPNEEDPDTVIVRYDSRTDPEPIELYDKWISAINSNDGIVEIEYIELI